MGKSNGGGETKLMLPTSPPTTATTRHNIPAVPLQIPSSKTEPPRPSKHRHARPTRPRDVQSPHAIPPSIHALLASTAIPRSRNARNARERRRVFEKEDGLTLEAVIERQQVPEKELSMSLGGPLDVLLSAPEDLDDDDGDSTSFSDSLFGSLASTRTVSVESVPSLTACSSPLCTSTSTDDSLPPYRRRASSQFAPRRSLEPVSLSPQGPDAHPLSAEVNPDDSDLTLPLPVDEALSRWDAAFSRLPLRSAFKSNLTASLRAIRSAAKSFSSLSLASVPPEDLLTRSILALEPGVPFTDERRPPVLEEEPSEALRRYLNPTTRVLEDGAGQRPRRYAASIQMRTYKVERLRENARASRLPVPVTPRTPAAGSAPAKQNILPPMPVVRQREMRENSDFIRVAVLEMAMRRRGKLDDQRPGRARWALPPRRAVTRAYEVGVDGVPVRWVPVTA